MSWFHEQDARRQGERDFERRGYADSQRYNDSWSDDNRAYRDGFDEARREHLRQEEEREEREAEHRRQEARQRDLAMQAEYERQQQDQYQDEAEPEPEPEPVVAAIQEVNERFYFGVRMTDGSCPVDVGYGPTAHTLPPCLDLANHSPDGFEWGYAGSGPAQLALAILAHHLKDDAQALALHQKFKFEVICKLPKSGWRLSAHDVEQAVAKILANKTAWP